MSERRKHKMFSLNAYSYNGIVSGGSPKLHVPVQPASVIYAQFDHVSGFAAKANQAGISVSKIHILNSLLNQVISMRTSPKPEIPKPDTSNLTQSQLDSLIKDYSKQVTSSIHTAQATGYGLAGAMPEPGAVFSLNV